MGSGVGVLVGVGVGVGVGLGVAVGVGVFVDGAEAVFECTGVPAGADGTSALGWQATAGRTMIKTKVLIKAKRFMQISSRLTQWTPTISLESVALSRILEVFDSTVVAVREKRLSRC